MLLEPFLKKHLGILAILISTLSIAIIIAWALLTHQQNQANLIKNKIARKNALINVYEASRDISKFAKSYHNIFKKINRVALLKQIQTEMDNIKDATVKIQAFDFIDNLSNLNQPKKKNQILEQAIKIKLESKQPFYLAAIINNLNKTIGYPIELNNCSTARSRLNSKRFIQDCQFTVFSVEYEES